MSDDIKLLQPAPTEPAKSEASPGGQSATAFIRAQRQVPKRPYADAQAPPPTDPPPADTPPPTPNDGPAANPGAGTGTGKDDADPKAAAEEFIETYDMLQAYGFHLYSDGMPMDRFILPDKMKQRAVHHLSRGLSKMGNAEVAWPLGVALAIVPPSFFNYLAAREHRAAKAETAEARTAPPTPPPPAKAKQPHTHRPTTVTLEDSEGRPIRTVSTTTGGACQAPGCTNPVKRGRKYCSQACSGRASRGRTKKAKAADQQPADEPVS